MKQTPNYALPYPECNRPFIADASDIIQIKSLADATDAAVQGLYDSASAVLVHPPAVRMQSGVQANGTSVQLSTISYTGFNFDNTPGQTMSDTAAGVILIPETAWYLVSHYISTAPTGGGGNAQHTSRLIRNGAPATSWSVISSVAAVDPVPLTRHTQVSEVLRLDEGDTLTSQVFRIGTVGATGWTSEGRIFAVRVLGLGL